MKSYLLVITGKASQPTLHHVFEIGSDAMAINYAVQQSKHITSDKYWEFVLFRTEGLDHEVLRAWDIKAKLVFQDNTPKEAPK